MFSFLPLKGQNQVRMVKGTSGPKTLRHVNDLDFAASKACEGGLLSIQIPPSHAARSPDL